MLEFIVLYNAVIHQLLLLVCIVWFLHIEKEEKC